MRDLIEALQIFAKYQNLDYPTWCSHDRFNICGIAEDEVTEIDRARLKELGFHFRESGDGGWHSYRFGSA